MNVTGKHVFQNSSYFFVTTRETGTLKSGIFPRQNEKIANGIGAATVRAAQPMILRHTTAAIAIAGAVALVAACASKPMKPPVPAGPTPKPTPVPVGWWKGSEVQGAPRIVVDLSEQRAYFYKGELVVGESKVSSGKKGFATPPGDYKVTQRSQNHVSNLYGNFVDEAGKIMRRDVDASKMKAPEGQVFSGAKMPFYLRFHNGYGLHAGRVPNYPASHGCVRLPRFMAEHFFKHSPLGTPVSVQE